jgi:putative spermidine/putrescine transport system permease protein
VGILAAFILASPVLVGVTYSVLGALGVVGPGSGQIAVSLSRFAQVLGDSAVWEGTLWTLWVSIASTILATLGAAGLAMLFRGSGWANRLGRALAFLPLPVPHLAAGVGVLLVLGQSGLLSRLAYHLNWIAGPADMPALVSDPFGIGLIVALTWKELPFLSLVAVSVLETRGIALEDTARGLGAGAWKTARLVTWPLLWRGMLPAALAVFTFVAGSYEAAVLLAPSDPLALPLLTWERYLDASLAMRGDAYVLALLGMLLALVAVAGHEWFRFREDIQLEVGGGRNGGTGL